jgi:LacI family transcriptional regulator
MTRKGSSKRTTLTEVARVAGVSPATASMVLSGKGGAVRIASSTADRVRAIAQDLDYSPNLLVRSLQNGSSGILAFFSAFRVVASEDVYMDRLSRGLELAAGRRGYDLLLHCAFDRSAEQTYASINGGRADGLLLFAPHNDDPVLDLMRKSRLPCVLLNTRDRDRRLPSVKDDYEHGMKCVAEALVERGHRHIAALHFGPEASPDAAERIRELDRNLERLGVARPPEYTIDGRFLPGSCVEALFTLPNRPTAIFCCNDRIASETVDLLESMGIQVPEQISVIGYDGLRWPSRHRHNVASVVVNIAAQSAAAVDLLIDGPSGERDITMPTVFVPGTTLGPALSLQRSNQ